MTLVLPALAAACPAFCVWLTVRIVNRKERWAKWTVTAVVAAPVLYVASFGPACWICSRHDQHNPIFVGIYRPLVRVYSACPWVIQKPILSYVELCLAPGAEFSPIGDWFFYFDER